MTHVAASIRSHVHLHTSAAYYTKPYLLNVHPALEEILNSISKFTRMNTDQISLELDIIHAYHRLAILGNFSCLEIVD